MNLVNLGGGNCIAQELALKHGSSPFSTNYKNDFDVVGYVSYEMPADGILPECPDGTIDCTQLKRIERTKEEYEAQ